MIRRKNVDFLIEQFWRKGYLTLSRKFGTYLPEPDKVGDFDVDVVARQKNKYAIGFALNQDEFSNFDNLINKIKYLATRQTRFGNVPVVLFIGVKEEDFIRLKLIINRIDEGIRKNIKLVKLSDPQEATRLSLVTRNQPLFS